MRGQALKKGAKPDRLKSKREGFTLIEILVALAIASGSLVLILSANNASLRRSARAALDERLERAAESNGTGWKIIERGGLSGAERSSEGPLVGFDGHHWEIRSVLEPQPPLHQLRRAIFTVSGPGGTKAIEWSRLIYTGENPR